MTDPVDGSARPGPGFAGAALAVLSAGTFGLSGVFASVLISARVVYFLLSAAAGEAVLPPLVMAWGGMRVVGIYGL